MGAVADFVEDTVGDVIETVGDVAEDVVEVAGDAVEAVGDTVGNVVEGALEDPIGTIATVAAIATQQYYLLPAISAGKVVANGGDLDDALKAAAITYVAGEVGGMAGDQVSTAANYGTELGSAQTAMLAAQDAGMGMGTLGGKLAGTVAGAGTGAALSGRDIDQSIMGALAGFGMNLGLNAAGQVVNDVGDVIADSYDEFLASQNQTADQPGDYPLNEQELAASDVELGGLPSIYEGDQPGDFPQNEQELAAADEQLAGMGVPGETVYGDQLGDFPQNEQELAAADEELAGLPAAEQYADQPGDYDTTPEEMAASEQALAAIPNAPIDTTAIDPLVEGTKKYLTDQFKGQFLKNMLGSGNNGGIYYKAPTATTGAAKTAPYGLASLLGTTLPSSGSTIQDTAESHTPVFKPNDSGLFNPLGHSTWAPLSKLSNLGEAGKYINQEKDTYFVNPEDAKKNQQQTDVGEHGWEAFGEQYTEPEDTLYYNYEDPNFFGDEVQYAAQGGLIGHNPEFFSEGGMGNRYVKGNGDGTSDSVPAMLATGEFVIPADVVSGLGNGDNDSGAKVLDEFLKAIRVHKRSTKSHELPPDSKGALSYLQEAQKKVKK